MADLQRRFRAVTLEEGIKASNKGLSVLWRPCGCRNIPCGCPKEAAILEWELARITPDSTKKAE